MPLAAINDLFKQLKGVAHSPLLPFRSQLKKKMVWVNENFFESEPQGITKKDASKDVQGFFSLLMTYVKGNGNLGGTHQSSPKGMSTIMPRTDFLTMYKSMEGKIKERDLYKVVKILSCYTNEEDGEVG